MSFGIRIGIIVPTIPRSSAEGWIFRQEADFWSRAAWNAISNPHTEVFKPKQMDLHIYIPTEEINESSLIQLIGKRTPQFQIEIFRSIKDSKTRLKKPHYTFTVAIVFAPNRQDITDVLSLDHLLRDIKIILVISHYNHGTLSMAHILRSRFISYFSFSSKEIDSGEITSVLQKILKHQTSLTYSN